MTKHKQYFEDMITYNQELFDEFEKIHQKYVEDPDTWQTAFNEKGEDVLAVIRKYENMLCGKSESGKYGKFSANLSEKFWAEVRAKFPKIDSVGLITS